MTIEDKVALLELVVQQLTARIELLEDAAGFYRPATSLEIERAELEIMEREARRVIRPLYERSVPGIVQLARSE